MAFPPNYNQERNNRARAKAQKAFDKKMKREEKSQERKQDRPASDDSNGQRPTTTERK